jgi:hypothetical protein
MGRDWVARVAPTVQAEGNSIFQTTSAKSLHNIAGKGKPRVASDELTHLPIGTNGKLRSGLSMTTVVTTLSFGCRN